MTEVKRQYRLQQFFGGYFHEDWDTDADNWTGIVDGFSAQSSPEECAQLARDIQWLATRNEAGQLLFDQLGCSYDPQADGITVAEWLSYLAERLEGQVQANGTG